MPGNYAKLRSDPRNLASNMSVVTESFSRYEQRLFIAARYATKLREASPLFAIVPAGINYLEALRNGTKLRPLKSLIHSPQSLFFGAILTAVTCSFSRTKHKPFIGSRTFVK